MKILKVMKKLFKFYREYGNLEVGLPQAGETEDEELNWIAKITTIEVDKDEKTLLIY